MSALPGLPDEGGARTAAGAGKCSTSLLAGPIGPFPRLDYGMSLLTPVREQRILPVNEGKFDTQAQS